MPIPDIICSPYTITRASPSWTLLATTDAIRGEIEIEGAERYQLVEYLRASTAVALGRKNVRRRISFERLREYADSFLARAAIWSEESQLGQGASDLSLMVTGMTGTITLGNAAIESWGAGLWDGVWTRRKFTISWGTVSGSIAETVIP